MPSLDVQLVLQQFQNLEPLCSFSLLEITLKLVMLMAFTQAVKILNLQWLLLGDINIRKNSIFYLFCGNFKHGRPKFNVWVVTFKDSSWCV